MGKSYRNTGPVPSWARFFNKSKNPETFYGSYSPHIIDKSKRENKKPIKQQNKHVDKTTSRKELKCNRANDHLKAINKR